MKIPVTDAPRSTAVLKTEAAPPEIGSHRRGSITKGLLWYLRTVSTVYRAIRKKFYLMGAAGTSLQFEVLYFFR